MELGNKLELIRQRHQISRKDLIGERISYSSYTRFINGNHRMSAENFIYFLYTMAASFQELTTFNNPYYEVNNYKDRISLAKEANDRGRLLALKNEVMDLSTSQLDSYHVLAIDLEVVLYNRLPQEFTNHLDRVETWNYKEMRIVSEYMTYMEPDFLFINLGKCLSTYSPDLIAEDKTELIRLAYRSIIYFLKQGDQERAQVILEQLQGYRQPLGFTIQKYYISLAEICYDCVMTGNRENYRRLSRLMKNFKTLGLDHLAAQLSIDYHSLQDIYNLKDLDQIEG